MFLYCKSHLRTGGSVPEAESLEPIHVDGERTADVTVFAYQKLSGATQAGRASSRSTTSDTAAESRRSQCYEVQVSCQDGRTEQYPEQNIMPSPM